MKAARSNLRFQDRRVADLEANSPIRPQRSDQDLTNGRRRFRQDAEELFESAGTESAVARQLLAMLIHRGTLPGFHRARRFLID
jgi:hypothetical protein